MDESPDVPCHYVPDAVVIARRAPPRRPPIQDGSQLPDRSELGLRAPVGRPARGRREAEGTRRQIPNSHSGPTLARRMRILVTGATGYIGGRLVPRLLEAGHHVRCLTRSPEKLDLQPWRHRVEVVPGDVLDAASIKAAATGCAAAYYLVHSMANSKDFGERDRIAASNFSDAATDGGIGRIVYLGALGEPSSARSKHLASRHEVGRILASGSTPVTELRAAIIIGSGSLSFEMLRALTEAAPVMTAPRWVRTACQPIAVTDVLDALVDSLEHDGSRIIDLGGPDIFSYEEMMQIYAQEAGLRRRRTVTLPLLLPRLSSTWIGLVTPLPASVARPLVEGLKSEVVVRSPDQRVGQTPFRVALRRALERLPAGVTTRWSDADTESPEPSLADPRWNGGTTYLNRQVIPTEADTSHLFWAFSRIGGNNGYYWLDWAWRIRGFADQLVGGVGLRRGRRHPTVVRAGEAIDFWRVESVDPGKVLRLRAELRLPGEAWIEWEARQTGVGSDLVQSAWFRPRGLSGRFYWWVMLPVHQAVFPRMACRIAATAEERHYTCG